MSELTFCKQFLTALDARPIKLSSDHIADARQYPAQAAYTLPRLPHPPHPARPSPKPSNTTLPQSSTESASASPGTTTDPSTSSITITLKPMKPSHATITLPSIPTARTSIFDLKQSYATQTSLAVNKIKILWRKKPVADSKTVGEVIGQDAGKEVEFSVMVMGGAAGGTPVTSPPAVAPPSEAEKGLGGNAGSGPAAQGPSGKDVVATSEFWDDLKGFVVQRLRDEEEGERLFGLFKAAYEKDR